MTLSPMPIIGHVTKAGPKQAGPKATLIVSHEYSLSAKHPIECNNGSLWQTNMAIGKGCVGQPAHLSAHACGMITEGARLLL